MKELFTAEQYANWDRTLEERRTTRVNHRAPGSSAMTNAERQALHVARQNEIGDIPRVRHRRVRESCRYDLVRFGRIYFGGTSVLKHLPSGVIVQTYLRCLQDVILRGGQFVVEFPRGSGKTTWMMIALLWALLYGHKRYAVIVAASGKHAKKILKNVMRMIWTFPRIVADFPAISIPFMRVGGVAQRASSQTYQGEKTFIEQGVELVKFPVVRDKSGNFLEDGCGATFMAVGKGAAIKGQNELGERPDIVLLDDPQTRKDACSASATEMIDEYIHDDILGLGGHDAPPMSCLVTVTPVKQGDIATRLVSPALHPGWISVVQPFVIEWPQEHERLISEFLEKYNGDRARKDSELASSKQYYLDHAAEFAAMRVIDPEAYNHDTEVDAKHHALNLIGKHGIQVFRAQFQMKVDDSGAVSRLEPEMVCRSVNGYGRRVLPPGMVGAVAFVDVNTQEGSGLSWVTVGFGKRRTACVVDYGRFPKYGALVEPGTTATRRDQIVAAAVRTVVEELAGKRLTRPGLPSVLPNAVCFDRGWSAQVITRTLAVIRKTMPLPFALLCSLGRGWKMFASHESKVKRWGDHIVARESMLGDYLEIHADYWREMGQSGFFSPPLSPGSTSVFGKDPSEHMVSGFADEVAAEKMQMRYTDPVSKKEAWAWESAVANHWGDALSGAFAVGSWFGFYDATNATVDLAATRGMDLFTYSAQTVPAAHDPDPWDAPETGAPEPKMPPSVSAPKVRAPKAVPAKGKPYFSKGKPYFSKGYW